MPPPGRWHGRRWLCVGLPGQTQSATALIIHLVAEEALQQPTEPPATALQASDPPLQRLWSPAVPLRRCPAP